MRWVLIIGVMLGVILIMQGLWALDFYLITERVQHQVIIQEIGEYFYYEQRQITKGFTLPSMPAYMKYLTILLGLFLTSLSTYWLGRLEKK